MIKIACNPKSSAIHRIVNNFSRPSSVESPITLSATMRLSTGPATNRYCSLPHPPQYVAYMGDNIVNFYSGQPPLNRVSFQRHIPEKINAHLQNPDTRFYLFKNFQPLVKKGEIGAPLYLQRKDVDHFVKDGFGMAPSSSSQQTAKLYEAIRLPSLAPLIFLGIDDHCEPTTNASPAIDHLNPQGTAYFAVDVTDVPFDEEKVGGEWGEARASGGAMEGWDAGVFAQARALVDWNGRNKFCPACGSPTYSLWAGWKRNCASVLNPTEGKDCFSTKGLHNFAYPRTDPVIIMGILDSTGEKMLLGRQKSWPKGMYSCLAGFIEPGESFEDAVRREVLEEAGIEVGPVRYSSSQPWPFPANLMVGCFGRAKDGQTIRTDLDNELEDAQWFPRSAITAIISHPDGSSYSRSELKKLEDKSESDQTTAAALAPAERKPGDVSGSNGHEMGITRLPPATAIAGVLIREWAKGGLDLVSKL
uniref:NAD(+) diphosphatase n=1 Tax=Cryptococcus bacillisporus CA1280 TaxID=1296109 RepID=A0A0D0TRH0_CRYGA|nr:NAD+ diphosphatase [Cryptococcus bacillisporus CA1280]